MPLLQGNELFVLYLIKSETIQTLGQFDVVQVNDIAHGPLVLPRVIQVFPKSMYVVFYGWHQGLKNIQTICRLIGDCVYCLMYREFVFDSY